MFLNVRCYKQPFKLISQTIFLLLLKQKGNFMKQTLKFTLLSFLIFLSQSAFSSPQEISNLKEELRQVEAQITQKNNDISRLKSEKQRLKREVDDLMSTMNTLAQEDKSMRGERQRYIQVCTGIEGQIRCLRQTKDQLIAAMNRGLATVNSVRSQLRDMVSQKEALDARHAQLMSKIDDLRDKINSNNNIFMTLKDKYDCRDDSRSAKCREITRLEALVSQYEINKRDVKNRLSDEERRLERKLQRDLEKLNIDNSSQDNNLRQQIAQQTAVLAAGACAITATACAAPVAVAGPSGLLNPACELVAPVCEGAAALAGAAFALSIPQSRIDHYQKGHNIKKFKEQANKRPKESTENYLQNNDFFHKEWSESKIDKAVEEVFSEAKSKEIINGQYSKIIDGEKVTIGLKDGTLRSAWGNNKYTMKDLGL